MCGRLGGGQPHLKNLGKHKKRKKRGPSFQNHEKPNWWGWGQSIAYL